MNGSNGGTGQVLGWIDGLGSTLNFFPHSGQ